MESIGERAYACAQRRGKKPSVLTCINAASEELKEYWEAHDLGRECGKYHLEVIDEINDDSKFLEYYEANIHNTAIDELADICIVAATWCYSSYLVDVQRGDPWQPERDLDSVMACGLVAFALATIDDAELFALAVNNKLRYNDIRKD